MAPYAASHRGRLTGRSPAHGPRAAPTALAGAPDQASSAGTAPKTAEPGAISARAPTSAPGSSMLRPPTRASGPTTTRPTCTTSPSIQ